MISDTIIHNIPYLNIPKIILSKMQSQPTHKPILTHSRNKHTDQLYTPLRQALLQSSQQKNRKQRMIRSSSMFDLKSSQISNKITELDPVYAEYLIRSIYIPSQELVVSGELGKVSGKRFVAIRVSSCQKGTITQQQLKHRIKTRGQNTSRTLYEIPRKTSNTKSLTPIIKQYTHLNNSQTLQYSVTTNGERPSVMQQSSGHKYSQYTQSTTLKKDDTVMQRESNQYGLAHRSRPQSQYLGKTVYNSIYAQGNINSMHQQQQRSTYFNDINTRSQKSISSYVSNKGEPLTKQHQITNLSNFTVQLQKQPSPNPFQPTNIITNLIQSNTVSNNNINSNENSNSNTNSRQSQRPRRKLEIVGKNQENKYNLFSALDYAVNGGCGGCGRNQIIASKPEHQWA